MTDYQPTISVGKHEFVRALQHGVELWNDGSTPTFRLDQRDDRNGFTRYCNARVEGKLAEEAFAAFLDRDFGIESRVDYDIYGDIEATDDGDLKCLLDANAEQHDLGVELDVKKTKPWNKWLAVRRSTFDRHPDDAPFVLTKLTIEDDLILDAWEGMSWDEMNEDSMFEARVVSFVENNLPVEVELVGSAYTEEFTDEFDQGDKLYHPEGGYEIGGPLRRDNVAIPCRDLVATPERWNRIARELTDGTPIDPDELST